jgi:hypothetical protein
LDEFIIINDNGVLTYSYILKIMKNFMIS